MRFSPSLRTRLVLSHLLVSLVSIVVISAVAGRSISRAAQDEVQQRLQTLAFATSSALEDPIQNLLSNKGQPGDLQAAIDPLLASQPYVFYGIYWPDGRLILRSSPLMPDAATQDDSPELWQIMHDGMIASSIVRPANQGERTIFVATPIQLHGTLMAVLNLGAPMQIAVTEARRALGLLVLSAFLVAIAVSLFGWVLASNLARPIKRLTETAERLAQGEMDARATPSGPPELHRLAEAFNSMAIRLQHYVNELRAFVANASHELRTPLTVVKLRTEVLQSGAVKEPALAEQFLKDIEFEVDRLSYMVNDLLDLSRMDADLSPHQRTPLDLDAIATEVFEAFNIRGTRAGIHMELKVDPDLPQVMGNEDQIRRVLYNLMENAIKYTPQDGQVTLQVQASAARDSITMLISDTGPGIAADHLPHIFERFYRVEATRPRYSATKGSGLGLAIAKTIVESHGGKIGVMSQMGKGTTFWVMLPVKP